MNTYFFDNGDLNGALSSSLDLLDGEENSVDGDVNVLLATGVLKMLSEGILNLNVKIIIKNF